VYSTLKTWLLIALCVVAIVVVALLDPIAQDNAYHAFADRRSFLGIANFWNVVTNLPFAVVGAAGLWLLYSGDRLAILGGLRPANAVFFAGVFLTAFGSGWYHLAPDNDTLTWDRLPMTLSFMAFFVIVIGEHVSLGAARKLLVPLLATGVVSVVYWHLTELRGAGDLRLYVLVQFLPMILIPLILLSHKSVFDRTGFVWGMLVVYVLAKLLEFLDGPVFEFGSPVSGHSLKHLFAACAPLLYLVGLTRRKLRE
jgi:hypothetical protein